MLKKAIKSNYEGGVRGVNHKKKYGVEKLAVTL
jgi:hypothetical protein